MKGNRKGEVRKEVRMKAKILAPHPHLYVSCVCWTEWMLPNLLFIFPLDVLSLVVLYYKSHFPLGALYFFFTTFFLVLSHDIHEATFLTTTGTHLAVVSCTIQKCVEIRNGKIQTRPGTFSFSSHLASPINVDSGNQLHVTYSTYRKRLTQI